MTTRILLLTGMTPDARIFERLIPYLPNSSVLSWVSPKSQESIRDYARRLASTIEPSGDVVVCGVSFGGIVARELALHLNARACVLVSSIRNPQQLPPWFRVLRPVARYPFESFLAGVGAVANCFPRRMRTRGTVRLTKLAGNDGAWHRWATAAVLGWNPSAELDQVHTIQIHGGRDTTFPLRYVKAQVVVASGGHVLPLTHPNTIAKILSDLAA